MHNNHNKFTPLYKRLGEIITPAGIFEEKTFHQILSDGICNIKKNFHNNYDFDIESAAWLSFYITETIDYLDQKDMNEISIVLLKSTITYCKLNTIPWLPIPSRLRKKLLSKKALHRESNR